MHLYNLIIPSNRQGEGKDLALTLSRAERIMMEFIDEKTILEKIKSINYIKKHLHLGAQRPSNADIIKKMFLDIELYIWIDFNSSETDRVLEQKLPNWFPDVTGLPEQILWRIAFENMRNNFKICSLASMLGISGEEGCFYVVSSTGCHTGAAVLWFPEVFEQYCIKMNKESCYILPSSTQEVIVLPFSKDINPNELAAIVQNINMTKVPKNLQLSDSVYFYQRGSKEVTIVAGNLYVGSTTLC